MDLREMVFGYVDWIYLAQDRDRWRALVNTIMNLRDPQNAGEFLDQLSVLLASQEGLCSME
jgi:hypothetical protein